jgi:hypothetical protein
MLITPLGSEVKLGMTSGVSPQSQFGCGRLRFPVQGGGDMAQTARGSAGPSGEVEQDEKQARVWADGLVELHQRIGGRFGRMEPRRRALAYSLRRLFVCARSAR